MYIAAKGLADPASHSGHLNLNVIEGQGCGLSHDVPYDRNQQSECSFSRSPESGLESAHLPRVQGYMSVYTVIVPKL